MIVPVWAASWELSCCQPEAEVGTRWVVPISFNPKTDPWWVSDHGASATVAQRDYGVADLMIRRDREAPRLLSAGELRFYGPSDLAEGRHQGRFFVDAHSDDHESIPGGGAVSAVDLVPIRFRLSDGAAGRQMYVPSEQLDPVRVSSTVE